ncbi:NAD(P)-dependent alcohol dehydrogenase [Arthrobacter sp. TMN-49]
MFNEAAKQATDASVTAGQAGKLMNAVVQEKYGDADVLHVAQIPRPTLADDEVLVQVHAAGLDRGTWHLMTGRPYLLRLGFGFRGPKNPVSGIDLAGTVVATGAAVTRFEIGAEVFGFGKGSFAEYAAVKENQLATKPPSLSFEQAAVVPISGGTALQAVSDAGHLSAGQKVLITGASGGVGSFAVQLAKAIGAEVTGVCSAAKADLVKSLGADHVIDYTTTDFSTSAERYDVILDFAGNTPVRRMRHVLKGKGILVVGGGEQGETVTGISKQLRAALLSPFVPQRLIMFISRQRVIDLQKLTELIESGAVAPCLDTVYPLEQAAEAMRHLADGKARGKIAIRVLAPKQ